MCQFVRSVWSVTNQMYMNQYYAYRFSPESTLKRLHRTNAGWNSSMTLSGQNFNWVERKSTISAIVPMIQWLKNSPSFACLDCRRIISDTITWSTHVNSADSCCYFCWCLLYAFKVFCLLGKRVKRLNSCFSKKAFNFRLTVNLKPQLPFSPIHSRYFCLSLGF